jgi:hypothetical protein
MIDKSKLKELAQQAMSIKWWDAMDLIMRAVEPDSASFMEAASPAAILELLAENEAAFAALRKAREDINWMLNSQKFLNGHVFDYIDQALATTASTEPADQASGVAPPFAAPVSQHDAGATVLSDEKIEHFARYYGSPRASTRIGVAYTFGPQSILYFARAIESELSSGFREGRNAQPEPRLASGGYWIKPLATPAADVPMPSKRDPDALMTTDRKGLFFPSFFVDGVSKDKEWFIAETVHGDRVALRSLGEESSYDYTTADHTHMKRANIKRWAQFPDSEYIASPDPVASEKEALRRLSVQGMADCMDMVRQDLIEMGIIDKSVAPMFIPEAIASYIKHLSAPIASQAKVVAEVPAKMSDEGSFRTVARKRGHTDFSLTISGNYHNPEVQALHERYEAEQAAERDHPSPIPPTRGTGGGVDAGGAVPAGWRIERWEKDRLIVTNGTSMRSIREGAEPTLYRYFSQIAAAPVPPAAPAEQQSAPTAQQSAQAERAALDEVISCFNAAEVEGLSTVLVETSDARLKDLVERRLMHALYAAQGVQEVEQPHMAGAARQGGNTSDELRAILSTIVAHGDVCAQDIERLVAWSDRRVAVARRDALESAKQACEGEYIPAPHAGMSEANKAYNLAIDGCIAAIRSTAADSPTPTNNEQGEQQ